METESVRTEKRNRLPVSCEPCRGRKLKCNRASPCDTCIRRNKQAQCHYAGNAKRNRSNVPSKQAQLQEKLKNLENLVSGLVSGQVPNPGARSGSGQGDDSESNVHGPSGTGAERITSSKEHLKAQPIDKESPRAVLGLGGQINYVDGSHWKSILEELKEVREQLTSEDQPLPRDTSASLGTVSDPDSVLVFPGSTSADLDDILNALPTQAICDVLVSHYFNARYAVLGLIHPDKFRLEYQRFWRAPAQVDLIWLGLLFAILSMATGLRQIAKGPDDTLPNIDVMQLRTTQCLVLGDHVAANEHVLEALILHMQSCFLTGRTSVNQLWVKMGHVIQLAFRMGYHRDPSKLPNISTLDGEMRRRVWMNIVQSEALGSFQVGFPSMIPTEYCDTRAPGNYEFSDLPVGIEVLPPPRPMTNDTPVLYTIAKHGVMLVFKKITAHTQTLAPTTYDRTISLDLEMREAYSTVPTILQRRDIRESFMDPASLIWQRCTIEMLYLKGLVVVHRPYLRQEHPNPRFEPSRRHCIEAALEILARQADISGASQPGGRLHEERWMLGALTVYDFLLAAMVLCLDLSVRTKQKPGAYDDLAKKELDALKVSQRIWAASRLFSAEANIAARTLELMIKSAERPPPSSPATEAPPPPYQSHAAAPQPAAPTQLTIPNPGNAGAFTGYPYQPPMFDMIDGSSALDWSLLDSYLQQPGGAAAEMGEAWDASTGSFLDDLNIG